MGSEHIVKCPDEAVLKEIARKRVIDNLEVEEIYSDVFDLIYGHPDCAKAYLRELNAVKEQKESQY